MSPLIAPQHAPGVVLHQVDDEAWLVEPRTGSTVSLDALALALWEMCDGETTVQEMTSASAALFDARESTISRDIGRVLSELVQEHLLICATTTEPSSGGAA